MSATIVIKPTAEQDLDDAAAWYSAIDSNLAGRFLHEVDKCLNSAGAFPRMHRCVYGEIRRISLARFPYLIWYIYEEASNALVVLAVSPARQDPVTVQRRLTDQ